MQQIIQLTFRQNIRQGEYQFSFALNGHDALEVIRRNPEISLVLTDLNMPGMDGLTLLRELRELNEFIRAIVVTAYGDMVNIRTAMNHGAFDFLIKPIDLKDLKLTVSKTLDEVCMIRQALSNRDQFIALKKELEIARQLQLSMMPCLPTEVSGFKIEGQMRLSSEVGGDFWDLIPLNSEETLLVLGDCSGHGLSSSLVMSAIRHSLRTLVSHLPNFQDLIPSLNQMVYREFRGKASYATMIFVHFKAGDAQVRLLRAGHELPFHRRQSSFLAPDWRGGLPIGIFPKRHRDEWVSLRFEPGDELYLVTDGIIDGLPDPQPPLNDVFLRFPDLASSIENQSFFDELASAHLWQNLDDATILKITPCPTKN